MQILRHDVEFLYIPQTVETGPVEGFLAETISPQFSADGEHGRVFAHRLEVVHLIETAIVRKAQDSLFGDDVIEFEFPSLDIKPTRAKEIAEAHIGGFKMKRTVVLRSRHKQKADVLSERPGGENVQAPNVKTMGGQPALGGGAGWERVSDVCVVHALAMPVRGDAERYRPIDRKSTRLNSSHLVISYAVFCLKKKKKKK